MEEIITTLKKSLNRWGNYHSKGNVVMLYDNAYLKDKEFLELCRDHKIRIQLDLFTPLPDDKK